MRLRAIGLRYETLPSCDPSHGSHCFLAQVVLAAGVVFEGVVKVTNKGDAVKTLAAGTYADTTVEL